MKRPLLAATAILALAAPACASARAVSTNAAAIRAGAYTLEPKHTQVLFSVLHMGFTYFSGLFSNAAGTLSIDPAHPEAAKLAVSLPVSSLLTTNATLNESLLAPARLGAARDPRASFVSTAVTPTGPDSARVAGTLTLRGVAKPETMAVTFIGAGIDPVDHAYTIGFEGRMTIRRADFGFGGLADIGPDVRLTIAAAFERK